MDEPTATYQALCDAAAKAASLSSEGIADAIARRRAEGLQTAG